MIVDPQVPGLVLRADNQGEGGVIALMALVRRPKGRTAPEGPGGHRTLRRVPPLWRRHDHSGHLGAQCRGGSRRHRAGSRPSWSPLTVGILVGLFLFKRRGTAGWGPFRTGDPGVVCAAGRLGLRGSCGKPRVLAAVSPSMPSLLRGTGGRVSGSRGCLPGGHRGRGALRRHGPLRHAAHPTAWFPLVLPALLLNYFGQGALLLRHPEAAHHPFYDLVPDWALYPMVFLATVATIIASQAVITGAFSLTRQAIQLGYLPRLKFPTRRPDRPDLHRPGQLAAHGLHHRAGPRF